MRSGMAAMVLLAALHGFSMASFAAGDAAVLQACAVDPSPPTCVADYVVLAPVCLLSGYRPCLVARARDAARDGDCRRAFALARACACHLPTTRNALEPAAVCDWLMTH